MQKMSDCNHTFPEVENFSVLKKSLRIDCSLLFSSLFPDVVSINSYVVCIHKSLVTNWEIKTIVTLPRNTPPHKSHNIQSSLQHPFAVSFQFSRDIKLVFSLPSESILSLYMFYYRILEKKKNT